MSAALKFVYIDAEGEQQTTSILQNFNFNITIDENTGKPNRIVISEKIEQIYCENNTLNNLYQSLYGGYNLQIYFVESVIDTESLIFDAETFSLADCYVRMSNSSDFDNPNIITHPLVASLEIEKS